MRLFASFLLVSIIFAGCRDANDPKFKLSFDEILTKQSWELRRYTSPTGEAILDNKLTNPTAIVIKSMYFIFDENNIVTAYDKASKKQITSGRGAWKASDDKSKISFELIGNDLDFRVISMSKDKMVWQSETGSFLTGVGPAINLEFAPRL